MIVHLWALDVHAYMPSVHSGGHTQPDLHSCYLAIKIAAVILSGH